MTDFEVYAAARAPTLRRTAFLLCGDWSRADDVVQNALMNLYRHWRRAARADDLDAYSRRILVRCWLDELRRTRRRREVITDTPPEPDAAASAVDGLGVREALLAALRQMPERQRACLVLRFWGDLSIAQTAELLDVSENTVKSQTSRGLATMRRLAGDLAPGGAERSQP